MLSPVERTPRTAVSCARTPSPTEVAPVNDAPQNFTLSRTLLHGEATVLDERVRKASELKPAQFTCPDFDPNTSPGLLDGIRRQLVPGRGLHSSTFRLNVSAFCGIGGALRGYSRGVYEVVGGKRGCLRRILCKKRLRLS